MATAKPKANVQVTLNKEKDTKNTVRFSEEGDRADHVIGILYVPKTTLAEIGNPDSITLTIEAA